MNQDAEIVAKKIESGAYYAEGMNWFHSKFTRPRTELSFFVMIALVAVMAFMVALVTVFDVFPLAPGRNIVIYEHISPDYHIAIQKMQKPGESPNDAYLKYLTAQYVVAREEYIEEHLDRNFGYITNFSNDAVYTEFLNENSLQNPKNPIVQYGRQATREVIVNDVKLVDAQGKPAHDMNIAKIIVSYTSVLTFLNDSSREITHREADISFQYKQFIVDQKTGKITQEPHLQITGYKTRSLD